MTYGLGLGNVEFSLMHCSVLYEYEDNELPPKLITSAY